MPQRPDISAALRVAGRLRAGRAVTDRAFDALLPRKPRAKSPSFWTPVEVAVLASRWFRALGVKKLLDVGAGAGKVCSIASLLLGRRVYGIEQRPHLAATARALAKSLGADVEIIEGSFAKVRAPDFDAFYFYDPFIEQVAGVRGHYDALVAFSDQRYLGDVKKVETWLKAARTGTAMITYHAMGGRIPGSWKLEREERVGEGLLRLWVKQAAPAI
ncbi:MAG: class I SAM-dependent methyltransferase, partial [Myxococcaceae bacterium]